MKYCQKCGTSIPDNASFCSNCGERTNSAPAPDATPFHHRICPDSYLALSIVSTLLCCLPLGIVAIVKSSNVSREFQMGNYEAALKASHDAKKWSIIAMICGASGLILYFIFLVIGLVALEY